MGGGRALSSLYVPSSLSGLKGSFSLSLTFSSRLAPNPFLVVYAIFPSGGVIADKVQFSVEMCFDNQVRWQLQVKSCGIKRHLVYAGVVYAGGWR